MQVELKQLQSAEFISNSNSKNESVSLSQDPQFTWTNLFPTKNTELTKLSVKHNFVVVHRGQEILDCWNVLTAFDQIICFDVENLKK